MTPREDIPDELVEIAARTLARGKEPFPEAREDARAVLSAVSEAGWMRREAARLVADESYRMMGAYEQAQNEANEARAQAEALAEALEQVRAGLNVLNHGQRRNFGVTRNCEVLARDALTAYRSSQEPSDAS